MLISSGGNKEGKAKDVDMDGGAEKEKEWNYGTVGPMEGTDGASAGASAPASTAGGDGTASKTIGKFGVVLGCGFQDIPACITW